MAAPLAAPPLLEDDWDDMSRFKLHATGSCSERRRRRRDDDDDDDDDDDIMEQDVGLTEQQKQQQHGVEVVVDLMDVLLDLKHDDTGCFVEERNNKTMDTCFKSTTEELMMMVVTDVDGRLSVCLTRDDGGDDLIISTAPVSLITEETLLERDQLWRDLTDNFGRVMPLDWKRSRARTLHLAAMFSQPQHTRACEELVDLSDDDELREQLDMHSIIVSCLNDEPLFTAEQVIEEIEELMQDSVEQAADQNPSQSELSVFSMELLTSSNTHCYEDKLRAMSLAELNEHLEEVDATIRSFSEELIVQLALRDELDFEKEVKEAFISVLIAVHNRQKEHRELQRKQKKTKSGAERAERAAHTLGSRFSMDGLSAAIQNGFRQTFGSGANERQYLTTVIPYEKKAGPPSIQDLQVLTQILQAMLEDSDKVPSLLTDYILKGENDSHMMRETVFQFSNQDERASFRRK